MIRHIFLAGIACLPLSAAAQESKSLSMENVKKATATVESVNHDARTVVLRHENDDRTFVVAGPEIRNFEQINAGDRVVATYREALLAEVKPKGTGVSEPKAAVGTVRAADGQPPGVGAVATVATTVVIESVDQSFDTVTFKRPDGIVRTVAVEDPKATQFVHKLKPGDEVQVTYTEATALALRPTTQN